jgi:hypothetical protein
LLILPTEAIEKGMQTRFGSGFGQKLLESYGADEQTPE